MLKRGLNGTYVAVEPFHLFRYIDEQAFRFNNPGLNDAGRFVKTLSQVTGKRLTFAEVTGRGLQARRTSGKPVEATSRGLSYRRQGRGKRKP